MRSRRFGSLARDVPVLGLGTWNMERDDRAAAIAAIRRALELGMIHVDTAEMYGGFPRSKPLEQLARDRGVLPRQLARDTPLDDATVAAIDRAFPLAPWQGLPTS